MGHSVNPKLVIERRELVKDLEAGKTTKWTCRPDPQSTRRLAAKIRETLSIARRYPEQFPALAAASNMFSIYEAADGVVEARYKSEKLVATSIQGLEPHGKPTPLVGMRTAEQVINSWNGSQPSNNPLHFTRTYLPYREMVKLHTWATSHTPRLMILVDDANKTMTLSLVDMSVVEFAWQPKQKPAPHEENLDL